MVEVSSIMKFQISKEAQIDLAMKSTNFYLSCDMKNLRIVRFLLEAGKFKIVQIEEIKNMKTLKNSLKQLTIIMTCYLTIKSHCSYKESNAQSWQRMFVSRTKKSKQSSKKCLELMKQSKKLLTVVIEKHLQLFIKQDNKQLCLQNKFNLELTILTEAIQVNLLAFQQVNSQASNNSMMKTTREESMKTLLRIMKDVDLIDL